MSAVAPQRPRTASAGHASLCAGDLGAAWAVYRVSIASDKADAGAWLGLSAVVRRRCQHSEARAHLVRAARLQSVEVPARAPPAEVRPIPLS